MTRYAVAVSSDRFGRNRSIGQPQFLPLRPILSVRSPIAAAAERVNPLSSNASERLGEIGDDVVDVLNAD